MSQTTDLSPSALRAPQTHDCFVCGGHASFGFMTRRGELWTCLSHRAVGDQEIVAPIGSSRTESAVLGRKNSLLTDSEGGARRWAIVASLVETAKLNGVEPYTWLGNSLVQMVEGRPATSLNGLMPRAYQPI